MHLIIKIKKYFMTNRLNKRLGKAKESAKTAWSKHKSLHCKKGFKVSRFSRPQPGCRLPNSHCPGIIKLFLARETGKDW
jgi:hypothetical protein